ncbi:PIN-like domain-containing protein [Carboxylicivirga linearis]|uniref:DUF4935 domain-containing protein n=1 Tax=Carboxylicivirga linearis TaxID=1628157 RepID=A0ABS5K1W6_9BACT|nr:PIN-like domain-containing protein [Carboxylicivirga linearis]MBS2101149.1 DUF4935 domain-containing protein [Carboxylicivirga linearis]
MSTEVISYLDKIEKSNLRNHKEVLQKYKDGLNNAIGLKGDTPIFLDTNVLLKSYSISFEAREELLKFYNHYKNRIFLTEQVQKEFTKNREDIIERFFEDVTQGLPNSFTKEILNHFKSFLEKNKTILVDYREFEKKLNNIKVELEDLSKELNNNIEVKKEENSDILLNDKFLELFYSCNCMYTDAPIAEKAISDFDIMSKKISKEKIDSLIKKPHVAFPGMGDLKTKPDNPYGDFIIFYEMMEYASSQKSDIIFLTYDTTKGDWMKQNKQPHIHYIENFYYNTGQLIYILDAQRIFEETLHIDFTSLIKINPSSVYNKWEITPLNLDELLKEKYPKELPDNEDTIEELCNELIYNGYDDLNFISREADKANVAFLQYVIHNSKKGGPVKFTKVGNLRVRLDMLNENYAIFDKIGEGDGEYTVQSLDRYANYHHLINN